MSYQSFPTATSCLGISALQYTCSATKQSIYLISLKIEIKSDSKLYIRFILVLKQSRLKQSKTLLNKLKLYKID